MEPPVRSQHAVARRSLAFFVDRANARVFLWGSSFPLGKHALRRARLKRTLSLILILSFLCTPPAEAAVRGKSARYVGGTLPVFKAAINGTWEMEEKAVQFTAEKSGGKVSIPYDKIETLEYGQKVGRRMSGSAVGNLLILTPVTLLLLFSKKRKHFLTVTYVDEEGKKQGAVFELAKGIVKDSMLTLESKSGKKVEYESDEAKKYLEKQ